MASHGMGEMPDVFGEVLRNADRTNVNLKVKEMCGWHRDTFPGSQPVSLNAQNLSYIRGEDFVVCEKTDGTRYLLLAYRDHALLVDRKNEVRLVRGMQFPSIVGNGHRGTLLDGELVLDIIDDGKGGKKRVHTYLVYDIISSNGRSLVDLSLKSRLAAAAAEVLFPRARLAETIPQADVAGGRLPGEPFGVLLKPMYALSQARHVWENVVPTLHHESDGLIFTPVALGYIPGTCNKLLKWKPDNTVDLLMDVVYIPSQPPKYRLFASRNGVVEYYMDYHATDKEDEEWGRGRYINRKIVECLYDLNRPMGPGQNPGGWAVLRVRDDKDLPNDIRVIDKILRAQRDAIGLEDLDAACTRSAGKSQGKKRGLEGGESGPPQSRQRP